MGHKHVHVGAAIAAIIAFILIVVSWATYWYYEEMKVKLLGTTENKYYWSYFDTSGQDSTTYPDDSQMKKIFSASLSFLTIGGAVVLGFIVLLFLRAFAFEKSALIKLLTIVCGIAAVVLLMISFFTFLGITKAIDKDSQGLCFGSGDNSPCKKFLGSFSNDIYSYTWGAGPGWWVLLGSIIFVIGATLSILTSK